MSTAAIGETFLDVEHVIHEVIRRHRIKYGGDLDDLASDANALFLLAYESYDEARGSFDQWVRYFVGKQLLTQRVKEVMRNNRLSRVTDYDLNQYEEGGSSLAELLDELSEDAQTVVQLTLDPNADIRLSLLQRGARTKPTPHRLWTSVVEFLKDCDWSPERIAESFREIRDALSG